MDKPWRSSTCYRAGLTGWILSLLYAVPAHAGGGIAQGLVPVEWALGIIPAAILLVILLRAWRKLVMLRAHHQAVVRESDVLRRENEFLKQAVLNRRDREEPVFPFEQAIPEVLPPVPILVQEDQAEEEKKAGQKKSGEFLAEQISHIWVEGNYIYYKLKDNPKYILRRDTLKNVYARLASQHFVRTHKSYLVNLEMVRQVNWKEIGLKDGSKVPLSRSYKESFRKAYLAYQEGLS